MRGGTHTPQEALEHWREADSLSPPYLVRANPLLTYAQKAEDGNRRKSVLQRARQRND
jgi:hypothetical protein